MAETSKAEIFELEDTGKQLKEQFEIQLRRLLKEIRDDGSQQPAQGAVESSHTAATAFFNHYEQFVGRSDLLQVHHREEWARGFYETCFNVLELVAGYYDTLRKACNSSGLDWTIYRPSRMAYGSMQRLVFNRLPDRRKEVDELTSTFARLDLPTEGFRKMRVQSLATSDKVMSYLFGLVFVTALLPIAVFIPEPSDFQYLVFRWIMSLSAAGIGAVLPGFLVVEGTIGNFAIRSGGAVGLFVLVYFINPQFLPA